MKPIELLDLILRSPAARSEAGLSKNCRGEGLLLRMRSESLETIGFMESIHEQALDERSNIRKLFFRCSFVHVTFVHYGDVLFVLGFAEPAIVA